MNLACIAYLVLNIRSEISRSKKENNYYKVRLLDLIFKGRTKLPCMLGPNYRILMYELPQIARP